MRINHERLLHRFLRYVRIDTRAGEVGATYPSSPGQLELGRLLLAELQALGLSDARQSEYGIVLATVPSNIPHSAPTIAFNSHLDTSPETSGANVQPQVVRNYDGRDLVLPGDPRRVLRVDEQPELKTAVGKTIITTDGTTLLGADDKAGVAVIMELAATLMEQPELPHGDLRICFTCDEEVGHGVDYVDLGELNATACYTLDGSGANEIDVETFSADLATVTVHGVNIHPSIGKDRMINALRAAAYFCGRLPSDALAPEKTAAREGFLHPYQLEGGVAEASLKILLRDFDTPQLGEYAELLRRAGSATMTAFPGATVDVQITPQYRNMADGLIADPRAVRYAVLAHERLGRIAEHTIVRGGTDGSRFTELGLPTPNLSTGQHNPHSPLEWACLDEMVQAVELLAMLAQVWAEEPN
ncbi:MAG TPA: peptidase T [Pirellulales bacterium]|jgi:tripeptide aminopeptidase|nr:peptidase T [Pirellulales bacterium]